MTVYLKQKNIRITIINQTWNDIAACKRICGNLLAALKKGQSSALWVSHIVYQILQSHYPNRRSPDGRWAKNGKIGRRWPIVGRHRHRFLQIFWSADDFFVEAPKWLIRRFSGFCHRWGVGRWSPDDRPTVCRPFKEIYIMKSADRRPIIGRQSAVDRPTVGRWHFIKEPSADRRRISAVIRPMVGRS